MKKTYSILVLISIVTIVGCVYVVSEAQKKTVDSTNNSQLKSYAYLFQHKENPYIGNTVGYFAHGAFLWYVPDWLPDNWHEVSRDDSGSMTWAPNVREDPYVFSNIEFYVATSTETFNAAYLYDKDQSTSMGSYQVSFKEVLMNKTSGGTLVLPIETSTRIYHVMGTNFDGSQTSDTYYLDGGNKTLRILFTADTDIISQFENNIRDMVERIGGLNIPQG